MNLNGQAQQPTAEENGPLVLLADSQLLFARQAGDLLQQRLRAHIAQWTQPPWAVYIGASNGCDPGFYDMACDALKPLGIEQVWFLRQSLADLEPMPAGPPAVILLAGGDPETGWQVIGEPAVRDWLLRSRQQGSLLLGISAGALHLTSGIVSGGGQARRKVFLDLYPAVTLVHEEQDHWPGYAAWQQCDPGPAIACLKIPFGAGVWIDRNRMETFGRQKARLMRRDGEIPLPYLTSNN
ncbi:MAG: hypothetical protein R3208_02795 [Ketobacteraceae bacterium]|nr:hypothetical protein [Ketobacteraceae bacterium]